MVPQIEEKKLPVIAFPMHPAGKARGGASIGAAQGTAIMRPVSMHQR
mgnify:CR=1 FL=1